MPAPYEIRVAHAADIPTPTFYEIARLRSAVFVVEQNTPYLDLDRRDLDAGALQVWAEGENGEVLGTIRVLDADDFDLEPAPDAAAPGLRSIGRVATNPDHRGRGVAAALIARGVEACAGSPILIHAQAYLEKWYQGFGFVVCGAGFDEDGIPHLPMLRPGDEAARERRCLNS